MSKPYLNYDEDSVSQLVCDDFLSFQKKLQKLRDFDDKIINILNTELPTQSFNLKSSVNPLDKCKNLQNEVEKYYEYRGNAIKRCVNKTREDILSYTQQTESNDVRHSRLVLREKQFILNKFKEELTVEEIIKGRSLKAIQEKCRAYV